MAKILRGSARGEEEGEGGEGVDDGLGAIVFMIVDLSGDPCLPRLVTQLGGGKDNWDCSLFFPERDRILCSNFCDFFLFFFLVSTFK